MTELTPERWERVQTIFERAADLTDGARRAYLDEACDDDTALRREVESLLAVDGGVDGFLAHPARPDRAIDGDARVAIDRYRIVRPLGAGGMGVVYLAERADDAFRQHVAVKVLKRGLDTDDFVRRFRVERQALAHLQHPNIARLIDGGATADGRPYLVIEHVDGVPIDRFCHEHGLDIRARIELFVKVCDAVAHAHQNLIVHRDLKPGNVLVDASGEPKLLDFGVAKVLDPEVAGGSLAVTATGHRLMTPRYASPEQIRGEPVTTATDVYALGVVLYELLSGRTPFETETGSTAELERRVCEQEPRRPSAVDDAPTGGGSTRTRTRTRTLRRELRGDLDTIVLKSLRKEPERRYATVDQFARDLRHFLANEPVSARPPSARYRFASFVRRRRTALRAAGLGLVLGVVVVAALVVALLVLPRMAAAARRDAHAILVGPDQQAAIFDAVFFLEREPNANDGGDAGLGPAPSIDDVERDMTALGRVERLYDRALRLNPFDEVSRREREVVRAARRLRRVPRTAPVPADVVDALDPSLTTLLRDGVDADRNASPATLREVGLLLLFARPGPEGIEALRAYEAVADPDPLVEGLLGQLYLALGHDDLAYPRLRAAYETYPQTRAMALGLAEAASGVRDHARALRLVEIASDLPGADPFDRLSRVRAQVLAAEGRVDEARRVFEHATRSISLGRAGCSSSNPVSCFEFGRFLDRQGDTEAALRSYARGCEVHRGVAAAAGVILAAYVELIERWVAGWSAEERARHLREPDAALPLDTRRVVECESVIVPFGVRDKLRLYVEARRELRLRLPRIAVWPEQAERYAAERAGWSEETEASRLARQLGVY